MGKKKEARANLRSFSVLKDGLSHPCLEIARRSSKKDDVVARHQPKDFMAAGRRICRQQDGFI